MVDLDLINKRIAVLKAELKELEMAKKVLRRLGATSMRRAATNKSGTLKKRTSRLTITKTAVEVLRGLNGEAAHYNRIAAEANKLGYKGKTGSTQVQVAKAFWATLKRQPEIFESVGDGRFKLK